jgi:hypothetical protein
MKRGERKIALRCAVYTRVSTAPRGPGRGAANLDQPGKPRRGGGGP